MPIGVPRDGRQERRTAFASPLQRGGAVRIAELDTAVPGNRQRLLGPLGDRLALLLRHQRHGDEHP